MPLMAGLLSFLLLLTAVPSLPKLVVPDFKDLTIKRQHTVADINSSLDTIYLKGPRQRMEIVTERRNNPSSTHINIAHCEERQSITLNPDAKLYVQSAIEDWAERAKRARPMPPTEMSGSDVNVTIDAVDTGEQKQFGRYIARRIKTTTTVEPDAGASMPASVEEVDGWYIDLTGLGCQDYGNRIAFGYLTAFVDGSTVRRDRVRVTHTGEEQRGFPLEETSRKTESGKTTITKVELLQFSETPVDPALFQIPPGYRPALRLWRGGYDMTRPDTLANRLQEYWAELKMSAQRLLR